LVVPWEHPCHGDNTRLICHDDEVVVSFTRERREIVVPTVAMSALT
jgi:hypothetical protein